MLTLQNSFCVSLNSSTSPAQPTAPSLFCMLSMLKERLQFQSVCMNSSSISRNPMIFITPASQTTFDCKNSAKSSLRELLIWRAYSSASIKWSNSRRTKRFAADVSWRMAQRLELISLVLFAQTTWLLPLSISELPLFSQSAAAEATITRNARLDAVVRVAPVVSSTNEVYS